MTIDELAALVGKKPEKWNNDDMDWIVDDEAGACVCKCQGSNDANLIVALRNAAPALLECARLLRWASPSDDAPWDYADQVDAALKRLEES